MYAIFKGMYKLNIPFDIQSAVPLCTVPFGQEQLPNSLHVMVL